MSAVIDYYDSLFSAKRGEWKVESGQNQEDEESQTTSWVFSLYFQNLQFTVSKIFSTYACILTSSEQACSFIAQHTQVPSCLRYLWTLLNRFSDPAHTLLQHVNLYIVSACVVFNIAEFNEQLKIVLAFLRLCHYTWDLNGKFPILEVSAHSGSYNAAFCSISSSSSSSIQLSHNTICTFSWF